MERYRDEWRDERDQESPDERAPDGCEDFIVPGDKASEDILGIQMFAYCDVHNKRFPAGEDCPEC